MKTKFYTPTAVTLCTLALLLAPGASYAGKVKLPPGDNSNFWERWKPAKQERIVALAGTPTATPDAANNAVVVSVPVVCGTNWHGMYVEPSPCTQADVEQIRLGAPYADITPSISVTSSQASLRPTPPPDGIVCRDNGIAYTSHDLMTGAIPNGRCAWQADVFGASLGALAISQKYMGQQTMRKHVTNQMNLDYDDAGSVVTESARDPLHVRLVGKDRDRQDDLKLADFRYQVIRLADSVPEQQRSSEVSADLMLCMSTQMTEYWERKIGRTDPRNVFAHEGYLPTSVLSECVSGHDRLGVTSQQLGHLSYSLPVSEIATRGQSSPWPGLDWVLTESAEQARSFIAKPPSWVEETTIHTLNGWWSAEGGVPANLTPELPVAAGALARLGRDAAPTLDTLAGVGARASFAMYSKDNSGIGWTDVRTACGPLDEALLPPSTSRSVIASFVASRQDTETCEKIAGPVFGAITNSAGPWNNSGAMSVFSEGIGIAPGGAHNILFVSGSDWQLMKVAPVGTGTYLAAFDLTPLPRRLGGEALMPANPRAVQRMLEKFSDAWVDELNQIRSIQSEFYRAPDGVLSESSAYTPYDPGFASAYATATGPADTKYWPVGFAMPILPDDWQGISPITDHGPVPVDLTSAFNEATK